MTEKVWFYETWSLVAAVASFGGQVALLVAFNGKPAFNWHGVTLNALISVLSVTMKTSLVFTIEECIGQWKWIIFSTGSRSLFDFERVDLASRGPLGCFKLIWRSRTPWTLRLGLIVVVLSLALDPFSQQLIRIDTVTYQASNKLAQCPRTRFYGRGEITMKSVNSTVDTTMRLPGNKSLSMPSGGEDRPQALEISDYWPAVTMEVAIDESLSDSYADNQTAVTCPSSYCTWPTYDALGVCHVCESLSDKLKFMDNFGGVLNSSEHIVNAEDVSAYVLPNGNFLPNFNGMPNDDLKGTYKYRSAPDNHPEEWSTWSMVTYGTGDPRKTNSMAEINTLIWSMTFIDSSLSRSDELDSHQREQLGDKNFSSGLEDSSANASSLKWPHRPVQALECALYYCAKSINTTTRDNKINEETEEMTQFIRDPNSWKPYDTPLEDNYAPENIPDDEDDLKVLDVAKAYAVIKMGDLELYDPTAPNGSRFGVSDGAVKSNSWILRDRLSASIFNEAAAKEILGKDANIPNGVTYGSRRVPRHLTAFSTNTFMKFQDIATRMTNEMRVNGEAGDSRGLSSQDSELGSSEVQGDIHDSVVFGNTEISEDQYRCEWYWAALHTFLLLSCIAFFILTQSACEEGGEELPNWNSSSLATMRQATAATKSLCGVIMRGELEEQAKKTKMSLSQEDDDLMLQLAEEDSETSDFAPQDDGEESFRLGILSRQSS